MYRVFSHTFCIPCLLWTFPLDANLKLSDKINTPMYLCTGVCLSTLGLQQVVTGCMLHQCAICFEVFVLSLHIPVPHVFCVYALCAILTCTNKQTHMHMCTGNRLNFRLAAEQAKPEGLQNVLTYNPVFYINILCANLIMISTVFYIYILFANLISTDK